MHFHNNILHLKRQIKIIKKNKIKIGTIGEKWKKKENNATCIDYESSSTITRLIIAEILNFWVNYIKNLWKSLSNDEFIL